MKSLKMSLLAVVAFVIASVASLNATTTYEAYGLYGGTAGPAGAKCSGPPTAVCARVIINAFADPVYPDRLTIFDATQTPIANYQVRFLSQPSGDELFVDFMP